MTADAGHGTAREREGGMSMRVVLLCALIAGDSVSAQAPAPQPAFEVASVKRNTSGRAAGSFRVPPAGTITYTNVPLRMVIRDAYQVNAYIEQYTLISGTYARLIGSPVTGAQPDAPRFDIQGKPPDDAPPEARRAMMRTLLEDRFRLRVHREMREMPVYELTVARPGRLGPNLATSTVDCDAYLTRRRAGSVAPEPVDARGRGWCLNTIAFTQPGVYSIRQAGPLKLLLQRVQPYLDRPLVDATGLSGNLEWTLTFARTGVNAPLGAPVTPPDVPGIFTAVQDQLGLKLQARQAPIEVLVVDSVELPTPD
jgi:uncharacterized protein (TIGR03435 family)